MTNGERIALPVGYSWQEAPEINAAFPKPDGWFYRHEALKGTKACFITREHIGTAHALDGDPEELAAEALKSGYRTGLSVNVYDHFGARSRQSVTSAARGIISDSREPLVLLSPVERFKQGGVVSFRGEFYSRQTKLGVTSIHPIHYVIEAVADAKNDRLYILNFETPEDLWTEDKAIAKVMLDRKVLD